MGAIIDDQKPDAFARWVAFGKRWEGGYVSPGQAKGRGDPGGETNHGISRRAYPHLDIANLTWDDAEVLYRQDYWNRVRGDELPPTVAFAAMDYAVHSGPGMAIRAIRESLGLPPKGGLTTQVMRKIRRVPEGDLAKAVIRHRSVLLAHLSTEQPQSAKGWAARLKAMSYEAGRLHRREPPSPEYATNAPESGAAAPVPLAGGQGPDA